MATAGEADHTSSPPSVFLSYASEDRSAARSIRDALTEAGLEVWYDESELGGGDEWDQKIRRQIRECDFFMPIISAQTQARHEGYFRREWRLAVDRTLDMADGHVFLIPVVIDGTEQAGAKVPDRFISVQWLKVPNGQPTAGLRALCARLLSGKEPEAAAPRRAFSPRAKASSAAARPIPEFPVEEPGQRVKFWVHVVGWALKSSWIFFQRLPRWIRTLAYLWLFVLVMEKGCAERHVTREHLTPEAAAKLKSISENYKGGGNKDDIAKLGADIARTFANDDSETAKGHNPLLAIPFVSAGGSAPESKVADSTFALLYGRLAISHQSKVGLSKEPLASLDIPAAVQRGRESGATFVLCGGLNARVPAAPVLTVDIVAVADGSVVWAKDFPTATSDPAAIASEIESHVPSLEDD